MLEGVYRRRHEHSSNPRGFVAYYCPKGVSPATPVTTDAGAAVNLDNTAYERLFASRTRPTSTRDTARQI